MEIILLEKIKNLGDLGDTVKVRPGFGRNYLVPQGKALPANEANRAVFQERKAELVRKAEESINAAKLRAEGINGKRLTITARAADEGKLYGSITPNDVVAAAAEAGIELLKAEIDMPEGPIRTVGTYELEIMLHSEVTANLSVEIVEETAVGAE